MGAAYNLTWVFLCICGAINGQVIIGNIIDSSTGLPVQSAHIEIDDLYSHSNDHGEFLIRTYTMYGQLKITHVRFEDHNQVLSVEDFRNGICELTIQLTPKVIDIEEIEISINRAPEVVFSHKIKHVSDFEMLDEHLIILVYAKEKRFKSQENIYEKLVKGAALYLADNKQFVLDSLDLGMGLFNLTSDFRNNVILESGERMHYVRVVGEKLTLSEIDPDFYHAFIRVTADSMAAKYYYSTFQGDFPSVEYYAFNTVNNTYSLLHQVSDKLGMELLRSEYKYLDGKHKVEAMYWARELKIDREIAAAYMTGFGCSQYFIKPNAPLYAMEPDILIFDHHANFIFTYDSSDRLKDSIPIHYHLKKGTFRDYKPNRDWSKEILKDETNHVVFTSYLIEGYTWIGKIDINSGEIVDIQQLQHKYIENLQIKNGKAYYIYRPFESDQKKYLYSEEIYCGLSSSSK